MTMITPPTPKIEIYDEGFTKGKDMLGRAATGKKLSALVERISQPMVIALDGGWGAGKSFFLQCWVGAHDLQNEGTAKTVYFDAFAHDFLDEPLASLMGVISERLEDGETAGWLSAATSKLTRAALPLTRIGLAVMSYGATEAGGAVVAAITKQTHEELDKAAKDFWTQEQGKRLAMEQFEQALIELTKGLEDGEAQKLVIVIDELDRCRPDYALSLLEIIKHFFAVPNVHFVLGVNLEQLENSVKARYGTGIDAGLYLQKFVTLTMGLPEQNANGQSSVFAYFEKQARAMGLHEDVIEDAQIVLKCYKDERALSLRDVERALSNLALAVGGSTPLDRQLGCFRMVTVTLCLLKACHRKTYNKFLRGDYAIDAVGTHFRLHTQFSYELSKEDHLSYLLYRAWAIFLAPDTIERGDGWHGFDPRFSLSNPENSLREQIQNHLEAFNIATEPD